MTDLLNQIDRRVKYLANYLPPARRRVTNKERAEAIHALGARVQSGNATSDECQRFARIMEILERGEARLKDATKHEQ
ncbi:MAG: hypothetical protein H0U60_04630 [Blastocatellia bacterium]|nr:hypothetical protein [Blastocatellia bacterium]